MPVFTINIGRFFVIDPKNNLTDDIDVKQDVIPIYSDKKYNRPPSKLKLLYDSLIVVLILLDLFFIFFDKIVMSTSFDAVANYIHINNWLGHYKIQYHAKIITAGELFTLFLIGELLARWLVAVVRKTYYRWFFFLFVHWYEVLGCFPLLRPLRLLRAVIIIKRLHQLGIKIIPNRWIKTGKFYGYVLLEELSDRVILTALENFRNQLKYSKTHQGLIAHTIDKNRNELQQTLLSLLRQELVPKLHTQLKDTLDKSLAVNVGYAVESALASTPELRRYLKLIPIAGAMIESQLLDIGRHIGQNVAQAVNHTLLDEKMLDTLMVHIAQGVAQIDTTDPNLQNLVATVVDDALNALEIQVKIQQWKHAEHLHL